MKLSDIAIRRAKPGDKPIKLNDGNGLFLSVQPNGARWWRLRYHFARKEKMLSLGTYPEISLKEARERREEARKLLANGIDPSEHRKATRLAQELASCATFEAVARQWDAEHMTAKAKSHRDKVMRRLEVDVFPWIGRRPIEQITAPEILVVLRRIVARGVLETAHRAQQNIGQVIRYAIATGRAVTDPTQSLRGALPAFKSANMASPAESPQKTAGLLRMMEAFKGSHHVACALRLLPLLFCRPGELRQMRWEEINRDTREWRYLVSKTQTQHIVPLSRQAMAILEDLHPLTGHLPGGWVFPGRNPRIPMSNMAINAAYRRMGIDTKTELTGHGWRSVARTMLHEHLHFNPEVIEHQLAHQVPDALGTAYNRTKFIKERREMMQAWADYLDQLKAGADVVKLRA